MGFVHTDLKIENVVMHSVLSFIGSVDVWYTIDFSFSHLHYVSLKSFIILNCVIFIISANTYLLHQELLNFMLVAMSTQLLCGPSPGLSDMNPFIDAAMAQVSR